MKCIWLIATEILAHRNYRNKRCTNPIPMHQWNSSTRALAHGDDCAKSDYPNLSIIHRFSLNHWSGINLNINKLNNLHQRKWNHFVFVVNFAHFGITIAGARCSGFTSQLWVLRRDTKASYFLSTMERDDMVCSHQSHPTLLSHPSPLTCAPTPPRFSLGISVWNCGFDLSKVTFSSRFM